MRALAAALAIGAAGAAGAATLDCAPRFPVFCANLHVGCAGRSALPAPAFRVTLGEGRAEVAFADGGAWRATARTSHAGVVLRPAAGRDWIRIAPDGGYSQRIYRRRGPLMAIGRCEPG